MREAVALNREQGDRFFDCIRKAGGMANPVPAIHSRCTFFFEGGRNIVCGTLWCIDSVSDTSCGMIIGMTAAYGKHLFGFTFKAFFIINLNILWRRLH